MRARLVGQAVTSLSVGTVYELQRQETWLITGVAMWRIDSFESRRVRLDFSSSGQASPDVTQLVADDVVFANAVELTDWSEMARLQVLICESCGFEHCEPGGWLCPRSAGGYVVFVPAFAAMLEGESESTEYGPPPYVTTKGIPLCDPAAYATLRERCAGLPAQEQLPRLNGIDLLRSLQWEAPMRVLGRFPVIPEVRRGLVLASSDGDAGVLVSRLSRLLNEVGEMNSVALRPALANERPVTLYLDGLAAPEWAPIVAGGVEDYLLSPMPRVVAGGWLNDPLI